jgi:hypothetical protein
VRRPFVSRDLLEHVELEVAIGDDPFQPAVFLLQLPQALHVRGLERAEMLPPAVDRLRADAVLLRHLRHRSLVGFTEDRHHLLFGESRLFHGSLGCRRRHSLKFQLVRKSPGRSLEMVDQNSASWNQLTRWLGLVERLGASIGPPPDPGSPGAPLIQSH